MDQEPSHMSEAISKFIDDEFNREYETEETKLQRIKEVIAEGGTLRDTMFKIRIIANSEETEDTYDWYNHGRIPTRRQRTWAWVQDEMSQMSTQEERMEILLEHEYLWPDDLRQAMRLQAQKKLGSEVFGDTCIPAE